MVKWSDEGMFLRNDTILRHCYNVSMFGVLIGSVQFVSAGPFGCGGQSAHQSREGVPCGVRNDVSMSTA